MKIENLLLMAFFYLSLFAFTIISCVTIKQGIDYSTVSVPQEGGFQFTKITNIDDKVDYPTMPNGSPIIFTKWLQDDKTISYSVNDFYLGNYFSLSGDGMKLAYVARKPTEGKTNIFVKYLNGGKQILQRTFRDNVGSPSFSPDNSKIVFKDHRQDRWNIALIGAESGSAVQQITNDSFYKDWPVFNPINDEIFFYQSEKYTSTEYTVTKDKNNNTIVDKTINSIDKYMLWKYDLNKNQLTQYSEAKYPNIFPDGNSAIISRLNTSTALYEIWKLDLLTGQEFLIISNQRSSLLTPVVSPDGKKILYVAISIDKDIPANFDLYTVNVDGTDPTQLTFFYGHDCCPKWSPDGKQIYFLSQRASEKGEWNIWKMSLKGDQK